MADKDKQRKGDGHTDVGTDVYFLGEDAVYGDRPEQEFNMRDPRQVEARLRAREAREKKL